MSESVKVGECEDVHGDKITFWTRDGNVFVDFGDSDEMEFDAERRDQFIKLWAEAERQAEAADDA